MKDKRILVTGGAGFLGYHLARQLPAKGVAFMAFNDIVPFIEREYPEGSVLAEVDVRDKEKMRDLIRDNRIDQIIHAAAALPLWPTREIMSTNIQGTRNVLELAKELDLERVIYISSTAVYGVPEKHPLVESDPLVGVGAYGTTKIESEKMCEQYRDLGMCVPVIRPKTFIGTARLGVFQILYDWVDSGKRIPVIGSGENLYQLLEVTDLIDAIYLAGTVDPDLANDTFNVGAQHYDKVKRDVGALCEFAGNGARVQPTPARLVKGALAVFEFMKISPLYKWVYGTADKDSYVSTKKIEDKLGWRANYSNEDALIASHKWYLEHKDELAHVESGVSHRVGWDQGVLKLVKRFL
ncbi:NAD-dependent epimerase/dehydratase family protein [candidate division GN15 bacterium]|nr:NAD-dependent epimerase/dehydratase family protein [candidate division GN15 bacterium]